MLRTIEAVIERDGRVRLLEPVSLTASHRALVTVLEEPGDPLPADETTLLSEPVRFEENGGAADKDWTPPAAGAPLRRGLSGDELRSFAGTISSEDLDIMERVIEEEFERIDPHGW
jgi:hypothetical protein